MTDKIKILIATGLYPPEIGGPATYARMLEEELPVHNFVVEVLPFGTVRHLPKIIRHIAFFFDLYKKAKEMDIVYALDPVSVGLPALVVGKLRKKTFIVRLGGDYAWEQGQQRFGLRADLDAYTADKRSTSFPVKILATVQSFVVRRAKKVIVPSEYMKSIVQTWGATEEQVQIIYSALFPLKVQESREVLRDQLSYKDIVITSVGRLVPWKGFETLIDIVGKLQNDSYKVTLVIAGDGPMEETLRKKIQQMNLEESVRLVGRLSKDALGATLKASDVFVLNTAYEGLSHQLLEVMDLGIPIVTTNVGGNPELIQDGMSGILCPFDDADKLVSAVRRIVDNQDLSIRLVQNARVRTKDFSQDVVVSELAELLKMQVCRKN